MIQSDRRHLRLLGPVSVDLIKKSQSEAPDIDIEIVPRFRSRRTIEILGYLAAEQRPVARDSLAALFWPDEMLSKGRANLSRELHNLAKILPGCWESSRQTVAFVPSPDTIVDIYHLQQLETGELWGEAAELLAGEFLEGLSLNHNPEFENWLLHERERWRRLSQDVLTQVVKSHIRRGHYADALIFTQRQLQLAPWSENVHMQAMRLLTWTGQRVAAIQQFETCKQALRRELDIEPAAETIALYQQIQAGELDFPPQIPAYLTEENARNKYTPIRFVGRENELAKLGKTFKEVLNGKSRIIFISGGPGRGKTALMEAFFNQMMGMFPDLLVAKGNCNAFSGVGDPYLPFREVMAMLTGEVEARWDAGAITRDHARRLWAAFPSNVKILLEEGDQLLDIFVTGESLLSRATSIEGNHAPNLPWLRELVKLNLSATQNIEKSHLFQQVTSVLLSIARRQPLIIVLDDLQWADNASISLLFHLGRSLIETESKLFIVCAYRPEEVSVGVPSPISGESVRHPLAGILNEFKRTYGDIWVDLGRLDKVEDRRFINAVLDVETNRFGDKFRGALFNRTGGHPLFTLELIQSMRERGDLLKDEDDIWVESQSLDWQVLPARVEAVIEERISRLDPELQEILTIASVEGEVFSAQVVAEVQDIPERQMLGQLSSVLERQHRLVVEQEDIVTSHSRISRYRFKHILFQDYLYKRLSSGERRLLHGDVAAAMENIYQDQLEELAVQLAHHFDRADDHKRAFDYHTIAAERAARVHESIEAISHYSLAIERSEKVSPDQAEVVSLHLGRGRIFERMGAFDQANADHKAALQMVRGMGESELEGQTYLDLGRLWSSRDHYQAQQYFRAALEIARITGKPKYLAKSLNWMGNWSSNNDEPEKAVAYHQEAIEIFEGLQEKQELANTLDLLGIANLMGGDPQTSIRHYNQAISLSRALDDRLRLASSLIGRATAVALPVLLASHPVASYRDPIHDLDEAFLLAKEVDSASNEVWARWSHSFLSMVYGDFGHAFREMKDALRIASEIGHREWEVAVRFGIGILYTIVFAPDLAYGYLEEGLRIAEDLKSPMWINLVRGVLVRAYLGLNDLGSAQDCLEKVISTDPPMDTLARRYCWLQRAELTLLLDDPKLALDITDRLIDSAPGMQSGRVITFLWLLKGSALAALDEQEKAASLFQEALENAMVTGERFLLWRIYACLSQHYQSIGNREAAVAEFSHSCSEVDKLAAGITDKVLQEKFLKGALNILGPAPGNQ